VVQVSTRPRTCQCRLDYRDFPWMNASHSCRQRHAAAGSAPHCRQGQRVPRSPGTRLSGVSSWPLPQRAGAKTFSLFALTALLRFRPHRQPGPGSDLGAPDD